MGTAQGTTTKPLYNPPDTRKSFSSISQRHIQGTQGSVATPGLVGVTHREEVDVCLGNFSFPFDFWGLFSTLFAISPQSVCTAFHLLISDERQRPLGLFAGLLVELFKLINSAREKHPRKSDDFK